MGQRPAPRVAPTRHLAAERPGVRLAADIGGTFTDIAVFDDRSSELVFGKALSTPSRLVDGISVGVEKAGSHYGAAGLFLHGSTIDINTVLERTGARTALIITANVDQQRAVRLCRQGFGGRRAVRQQRSCLRQQLIDRLRHAPHPLGNHVSRATGR